MYSQKILAELKKKKIGIGDLIKVESEKGEFVGLLMPRAQGDSEIIVMKLNSGYNIGVKASAIELIEKGTQGAGIKSTDETKKTDRHNIAILGCGGTIASRIEYKTGAAFPSIAPDELHLLFPSLKRWPVHSRQLFSLLSEDINVGHWKILASEIENEINDGASGIVVMHGTDTIAYTASAIAFMLQKLPFPIVFVGSQRSSDRPSSDNDMNLMNSVFSASTERFAESVICMHASSNDDFCYIHRGVKARKMHTSRRDAFKSINSKPLFRVDYRTEHFEQIGPDPLTRARKEELISSKTLSDNVALIYTHPGIKPEFVSKLDSYDGVVFIGTGLGHVPTNAFEDKHARGLLPQIRALVDSGIPVVMAPQTIYGRLCMRTYSAGRLLIDAGVIGDGADWTPESAYTKLCWVLGQRGGSNMKKVREMMMTNYVGELSECSIIDEIESEANL